MKQHIFSLFIAAIALSSCTKDKDAFCPPPGKQCDSTLYASLLPADTCVVFPELYGPSYIYERIGLGYSLIGKSPGNPDEWLYIIGRENNATGDEGAEIWKIDTCFGRKEMIVDSIYVQPKLNSNGWLLFMSRKDGLLYKITENGENLSVVSKEINNVNFDWCLNGEAFFYRARFKKVAYLVSIEGEVLDSFNLDCHAIAGRENRVALSLKSYAVTNTRIAILNLFNGSLTDVTDLADIGMGGPLSLIWESDESLIGVFAGRGFFRIHIPSGAVEPIKVVCDNFSYYYPVVDPEAPSWLISGRFDYTYPEIGHVYFTTSMVMLNTHTGEEWKLDLDQ